MIDKIKFRYGSVPRVSGPSVDIAPVTVFVGPNNSGKSRVLAELEEWSNGTRNNSGLITESVTFQVLTRAQVVADLVKLGAFSETNAEDFIRSNYFIDVRKGHQHTQGVFKDLLNAASGTSLLEQMGYSPVRKLLTSRLDGQNRLSLLSDQRLGNLQLSTADNFLAQLFRDNLLRERVRQIVFEALGKYFVIDPTDTGTLKVKLSDKAPRSEMEEKSLMEETVSFFREATSIQATSDGIRAFVGIIATLIAGDPSVTLIDEPEAFLHPALAMKLGKEVSRLVKDPKRLFVSTHSASFLMGCIQSGSPVNIIRLTYKDDVASTRILEQTRLLHLMRNPLLRSTGVLDGLFYEAVIVTEADRDRAFYQEINERLRTFNDSRGLANCLFINAQGKQTVWDIVKPLRELGIPAVGIVDLDMVKDGGNEFTKIMNSTSVPAVQHRSMGEMRGELRRELDLTVPANVTSEASRKHWWKAHGGIELLDSTTKQGANSYFDSLEGYGIFVVRNGEVEHWLRHLEIPAAHKAEWLHDIFVRMGEDPAIDTYVRPEAGDVWDFMGRIKRWVDNPQRFGIPN
jgi:predicted ATPase